MSFERIAGPRKSPAMKEKNSGRSGGNVKGSNPGGANVASPVKHTFIEKGGKQSRSNVKGRIKNLD